MLSEFLLRCRALLSFFLRVLIPIYPWGQVQISELLSGAIAVHAFATQTSQKLVFKRARFCNSLRAYTAARLLK